MNCLPARHKLGVLATVLLLPAAASAAKPSSTGAPVKPPVLVTSLEPATAAPRDPLFLLARALSAAPTGGNSTLRIMLAAARKGYYLPAISWSMAQEHWDLARALIRTDPQPVPDWVRLSLALQDHDLSALAALVAHPHRLPSHDLVSAYVMLGDYDRAQYWAFQRLQDHPRDHHLRQQYLEVVSYNASAITLGTNWLSFSGLQRYATILNGKIFIGPNWGLLLRSDYNWQTADAASFLTGIPAGEQSAEAGFFLKSPLWQIRA